MPSAPAPQAAPPAPVDAGPGEFTRMISTLGVSGAPSAAAPPVQPASQQQAPAAPPVKVEVQVPVQTPAPPAIAASVAAPKAPPIAASVPPAPKLAPPLPAAAAKGKFDAIVPLLLIVNTFLLLAILLVLLFQVRGH